MSNDLFSPFTLGPYALSNRIVMAPMTRSRAGEGDAPTPLTAAYYAQRATAGLIITEATQVSTQAKGYPGTPGIFTDMQVANWRKVTDAVHAQGGRIFLQLWHVGRVSLTNQQDLGAMPVGPSALKAAGKTFTGGEYFTPRALDLQEIPGIVQQYVDGSQHAKAAGFDGVEIHGANGYLLDQFLRDGTNKREDAYGGTVANRARLLIETTEAVSGVWGKDRVGVRLSPLSDFNDMHDSDPAKTFVYAAQELSRLGIAYLHVMNPTNSMQPLVAPDPNAVASKMRAAFPGAFILNGGYNQETGNAAIASGAADLISFGMPFIANPDLVRRYAEHAPLNAPDPATIYSGDAHGYTDYPTLA